MTAVMCLGGFSPAGVAGTSVYAADEISKDVIGQYTVQGYENPELGFKVQLPEKYVLKARESAVQLNEDAGDVVAQSNSEGAYSNVKMEAGLGQTATVFGSCTDDSASSVYIFLQTPGIGNDYWDEESVVAENTAEDYQDSLRNVVGEDAEITEFETNVDTDQFAGKEHAIGMYRCKINGTPFYGAQVYMRSDDKQYLIVADFQSTDPDEITNMETYFTALQ